MEAATQSALLYTMIPAAGLFVAYIVFFKKWMSLKKTKSIATENVFKVLVLISLNTSLGLFFLGACMPLYYVEGAPWFVKGASLFLAAIGFIHFGKAFLVPFRYAFQICRDCRRRAPTYVHTSTEHLGSEQITRQVTKSAEFKNNWGMKVGSINWKEKQAGVRDHFKKTMACMDCKGTHSYNTNSDTYVA